MLQFLISIFRDNTNRRHAIVSTFEKSHCFHISAKRFTISVKGSRKKELPRIYIEINYRNQSTYKRKWWWIVEYGFRNSQFRRWHRARNGAFVLALIVTSLPSKEKKKERKKWYNSSNRPLLTRFIRRRNRGQRNYRELLAKTAHG